MTMIGKREVLRELPSKFYGKGPQRVRQLLLQCPVCKMISRSSLEGAKRTGCKCSTSNTPVQNALFDNMIAPVVADATGTRYGGGGRFWKDTTDGDCIIAFKLYCNAPKRPVSLKVRRATAAARSARSAP